MIYFSFLNRLTGGSSVCLRQLSPVDFLKPFCCVATYIYLFYLLQICHIGGLDCPHVSGLNSECTKMRISVMGSFCGVKWPQIKK